MSRGRKAKTASINLTWEQIFDKSQGFYFQYILTLIGRKKIQITDENSENLVEQIKVEKQRLVDEKKVKFELPLPKIKDDEIPFEIPANWIWCRLGDLFEIVRGSSPRPKGDLRYFSKEKTDYNWISISDITAFSINGKLTATREYLTEEGTNFSRYVCQNDIIVAVSGSVGKACMLEIDGYIYDGLLAIRNIYDTQIREFIFYFFKVIESELLGKATGAIWQNINTTIAKMQPIPIPPITEQRQILSFFHDFGKNKLDKNQVYFDSDIESEVVSIHQAQIYNNQITTELSNQLELVSQLRQAFLREAMQGKLVPQDGQDEPAASLLEKIKDEKEKLIAEKKIKKQKPLPEIKPEEIPFEIPNNWTWCRLGDCSINRDGERVPISLPERERRKKIYDYYGASGVIDKIDDFTHDGRFLLIGEDGANLVARSTPIAFIVEGQFWVNNHAHVIETVDKITTDYFCNYVNGISLQPYITGGFQPKLSQGNLNLIVVPLPPLAEQKRIVEKLEKLMKFCDELEANIREGKQNAESLLQVALKEALEPQ